MKTKELQRIKEILKNNNIKNKKSKKGLWIYTPFTTFFISNYDLELKGNDSKKYNDWLINETIKLSKEA